SWACTTPGRWRGWRRRRWTWPGWAPGWRWRPCSMAAVERLQFADQGPGHLRAVAVEHAGVVGVEQRILDAGETRAAAALDHHRVLRLRHVQDRHAVDRRRGIGPGHRVDHVVGA